MAAEVRVAAPAKLNLALHVTGRRSDGYHLLDSLVAFTALGDTVGVTPTDAAPLHVEGTFASDVPTGPDNLCLRAAALAGAQVAIRLHKTLPVASGIGGGSADAAAVLRALHRMGVPLPPAPERLGSDVPVCLAGLPTRMRGAGERLDPLPPLPPVAVVLVNPGIALSTPEVFAALTRRDNSGLPAIPDFADAAALIRWLHGCRNDLEAPAIALVPAIADVLAALRRAGAELARMSGSGATCFGLFADASAANRAAAILARPGWWVAATQLA